MSNRFYQPGEQRAEKVNDLFGRIAPRYDLINDLQSFGLHRIWKGRFARMADPGPDRRVLDLCCGTGDISFRLAAAGARTVGLDFSNAMLEVARSRCRKANASLALEFIQGDALRCPFPDASFDAITIAYGLRNLANVEQGLREMWRLAKPGGSLLVLDFGKPDNVYWRAVYYWYLSRIVPLFGKFLCGDAAPYAYIMESLIHYPAQDGVAETMRAIGCRDVGIIRLLGGMMTINKGIKQA